MSRLNQSSSWQRFVPVLFLTLTLGACASLAPPPGPPTREVPAAFAAAVAPGAESGLIAQTPAPKANPWWERFGDAELSRLVARARENNHDLAESLARLEAARAARGLAGWLFAPGGTAGAGFAEGRPAGEPRPAKSSQLSAGLDASWEIDLFGRVRSQRRAADAGLEGARAFTEQVELVLAAEVVRTYFEARGAEERAGLLARFYADQEAIVEIEKQRFELGRISGDIYDRAAAELAASGVALLAERDRFATLENALAVLIGEAPGSFRLTAAVPLGELRLEEIAIGDPAALLVRRPDVAAAAAALERERAEIGVATADLFPQLTLRGSFGFVAGSGSDLGLSTSRFWSFGPSLSWGIFDLGRVRSHIGIEKAESRAALAAWERTVLRALEEAENAFRFYTSAQKALGLRLDQQRHATTAAQAAAARYEEGAAPFLEALLARRDALAAELARVDALVGHRTSAVAVFKALGGLEG